MYLLVFLCLETRELIVSPATEHPNSQWVCEQTQAFLDQTANRGEKKPSIVMHDRDTKFTSAFVDTLKAGQIPATGYVPPGIHGYNALEGTFLGGCLFSGRAAGRAASSAS